MQSGKRKWVISISPGQNERAQRVRLRPVPFLLVVSTLLIGVTASTGLYLFILEAHSFLEPQSPAR